MKTKLYSTYNNTKNIQMAICFFTKAKYIASRYFKMLYYSMVQTHLEYGCVLCTPQENS